MTQRRAPLWIGQSEIRFNDDGSIDEIVIRDSVNRCLLHIEQMSDTHYWGAVYDGSEDHDSDTHFGFFFKNGRSHITCVTE